jgi:hypothetical protein
VSDGLESIAALLSILLDFVVHLAAKRQAFQQNDESLSP